MKFMEKKYLYWYRKENIMEGAVFRMNKNMKEYDWNEFIYSNAVYINWNILLLHAAIKNYHIPNANYNMPYLHFYFGFSVI